MVHIKVKKGLNIPLEGNAHGTLLHLPIPRQLGLDVSCFEEVKFRLICKVGDRVLMGQPLAEDKAGRIFVSPGSGILKEVNRGLKRSLLNLVIETDEEQVPFLHTPCDPFAAKEIVMEKLLQGGMFSRMRSRPCDLLADPKKLPHAIFIQGVDTAPFAPPPELEVEGFESAFESGLRALSHIADGKVHLVYSKHSKFPPFRAAPVHQHTVEGPHPAGNPSLHISFIEPILKSSTAIWTLTTWDVVAIGRLLQEGVVHSTRVISIAGEGISEKQRGYYRAYLGHPVSAFVDKLTRGPVRLISGDPLMGVKVEKQGYLGFHHRVFCAIDEAPAKREFLHFLKIGFKKYTATRAYYSCLSPSQFTTHQHGEERAFVDSEVYDKVMPLLIPTVYFIKALLAEDYEKAEELGLLEVSPEDFALSTFICPSKIDMVEIVRKGLRTYASQHLL